MDTKWKFLDVFAPEMEKNCNMVKCKLSEIFSSPKKIEELKKIPEGTQPIKDAFILPAGGAVVTRISTREPASWLAHSLSLFLFSLDQQDRHLMRPYKSACSGHNKRCKIMHQNSLH